MRILFVHPATAMAISDVARGYRSALERQGHEISDYSLLHRFDYHRNSLPPEVAADQALVSRMASECILNEALYANAELVIIISGLNCHPIALWLLGKIGIPVAVVLTESPYDDESQKTWTEMNGFDSGIDLTVFTNDRHSAEAHGWHLLPPSFDPAVHHPIEPEADRACDVVLVGTGFGERQSFLEAVDWQGINFKLFGVWPGIKDQPDSPIHQFYTPAVVDNNTIAKVYCSAKICINLHRRHVLALTPGPRVYETAACGAFQLSDVREDQSLLFGGSVPTFNSPQGLGDMIRYYLLHEEERKHLADQARERVQGETFDTRAATLISAFESRERKTAGTTTTAGTLATSMASGAMTAND